MLYEVITVQALLIQPMAFIRAATKWWIVITSYSIHYTKLYDIDKNLSEKLRDDLLHNISATSGMVQRGERIITLGEIVNDNSFKVLESFRKEYERLV